MQVSETHLADTTGVCRDVAANATEMTRGQIQWDLLCQVSIGRKGEFKSWKAYLEPSLGKGLVQFLQDTASVTDQITLS